jgi:hypothetical protein
MSNQSEKGSPALLEQWGHCEPTEHIGEAARHFPGLISINGPGHLLGLFFSFFFFFFFDGTRV